MFAARNFMFFHVRYTLGVIENGKTEKAKLKEQTDVPPNPSQYVT